MESEASQADLEPVGRRGEWQGRVGVGRCLAVKYTYCSCREPRFSPQHPCQAALPTLTIWSFSDMFDTHKQVPQKQKSNVILGSGRGDTYLQSQDSRDWDRRISGLSKPELHGETLSQMKKRMLAS